MILILILNHLKYDFTQHCLRVMMPRHIINTAADRPSQNAIISCSLWSEMFSLSTVTGATK